MSDTQTLALIEALERRVAHLEILEAPLVLIPSVVGWDNTIANFTGAGNIVYTESLISLAPTEGSHLWGFWVFVSRNQTAARTISLRASVYEDGIVTNHVLTQGHSAIDERQAMALVYRSSVEVAAGAHTLQLFITVINVNDKVQCFNLTTLGFYTRAQ